MRRTLIATVFLFSSSYLFAAATLNNIQLLGTVIGNKGKKEYAIISVPHIESTGFLVGDELVPGYVLERILADRIRIRSSTGSFEIRIGAPFNQADGESTTDVSYRFDPNASFHPYGENHVGSNVDSQPLPEPVTPFPPDLADPNRNLIPDPDGGGFILPEQPVR